MSRHDPNLAVRIDTMAALIHAADKARRASKVIATMADDLEKAIEAISYEHGVRAVDALPISSKALHIAVEHADATGLTVRQLRGPEKTKPVSRARQAFMAACSDAGIFQVDIGRFLGNRDHTTVMHGIKAHRDRVAAGLVDQFGRAI